MGMPTNAGRRVSSLNMQRPISAAVLAVVFYDELAFDNINKERGDLMPTIKPVSDLRNYNEVLRDVVMGEPVFLTKNGRGKYALMDITDYEKTQATIKLIDELAKGRESSGE